MPMVQLKLVFNNTVYAAKIKVATNVVCRIKSFNYRMHAVINIPNAEFILKHSRKLSVLCTVLKN
jgi:hypothetical protein